MAPQPPQPVYAKDERVLCFHGELLYEAKILDHKNQEPNDKKSPFIYFVHYKGWKNTWDDWVSGERIRKLTEENKELAKSLKRDLDAASRRPPPTKATHAKKRAGGSDHDSNHGSEERQTSLPALSRNKRGRDELDKEEAFLSRPEIRIHCPDPLKSILVDDWENITKNLLLIKLPAPIPANQILETYHSEERGKRREGSADADILDEVIAGLKEYFSKSLGRILLYRFEREQYARLRRSWEGADPKRKGPGDVYGGEHLTRLIISMPELIAQTNMDAQSVHRLREEMSKICLWLARHHKKYFNVYESASEDYIGQARSM